MRVAAREQTDGNRWDVRILDVSPSALVLEGDQYVVKAGATVDTVTALKASGEKNARARMKKLAARHDAIDLEDPDVVSRALEGYDLDAAADGDETAVNQADVHAMMADYEDDEDDDLDLDLLSMGHTADDVAGMSVAQKKKAVAEGKNVNEDKPAKKKRTRKRPAKPAAAAPAEEVVTDTPPPIEEPPRRRRRKRRRPVKEPNAADTPAPPTTPEVAVRGYTVHAWRSEWPNVGDVARTYSLGQTPSEDEANAIAARWDEAGFKTKVSALAAHHKARTGKRTIYTGDPVDPILCAIDGCSWVGDHLGPHLKSHGLSLDQYREVYKYQGDSMVGRAKAALNRAHTSVKRRNDLRVGMMVAEIKGDADVDVYRIDATNHGALEVTLEWVTGTSDEDGHQVTVTLADFFKRFSPVGSWSKRLQRDTRRDWKG